jgi:hypothetical protein
MRKYFSALKNVAQAVSEMPEVQVAVGGAFALSGWIVADINRRKINELESIDRLTENWDTVKVGSMMMDDIRNGATLTYRQKRLSPGNLYTQCTTRPGGFSEEMDKEFEEASLDTVSKWFEEMPDAS